MVNAGIGLIKKTELDIRYLPNYNFSLGFIGKGSVNLWGIGLKHDLMQYIPIVGNTIPLDLSFQFGHTSLNTNFNYEPSDGINQDVDLNVSSTTINLIQRLKKYLYSLDTQVLGTILTKRYLTPIQMENLISVIMNLIFQSI